MKLNFGFIDIILVQDPFMFHVGTMEYIRIYFICMYKNISIVQPLTYIKTFW